MREEEENELENEEEEEDDDEEEEEEEEEEDDEKKEDTVKQVIARFINLEVMERQYCRKDTEDYDQSRKDLSRAVENLSQSDRIVYCRIINEADPIDGAYEIKPQSSMEYGCMIAMEAARTITASNLIIRLHKMLDCRAEGETPLSGIVGWIFYLEDLEREPYSETTPSKLIGKCVRLAVETPDAERRHQLVWVRVIRSSHDEEDGDLVGVVVGKPSPASNTVPGDIFEFGVGEVMDVWHDGPPTGDELTAKEDGAHHIHAFLERRGSEKSLEECGDLWLKLSEQERAVMEMIYDFIQRENEREQRTAAE